MARVKLGISNMAPDGLAAYASTIKTAMTANANFATPNPTLASVGTLITTLQTKIAAYNSLLTSVATALADRETAELALRGALTSLASYVDNITNGDRVKIESSGMGVRGANSPVGLLLAPESLSVQASTFEGALEASWIGVRGAMSYEVQTSLDPVTSSSWSFKDVSSSASIHLEDFTSGVKMWVRIRAIGANNNKSPWSDPAAKTVP